MKCAFFAALLGLLLVDGRAFAQTNTTRQGQNVLAEPVCFYVRSTAPYQVTGTVSTDYYTREDGIRARHRSNFRLETGEKERFCASGPFFPGQKLELTLRSLVPLFSCRTRIDRDEIVVRGKIKPDGTTETWAECY